MATYNEVRYRRLKRDLAEAKQAVKAAAIDAERDHYRSRVAQIEDEMHSVWQIVEQERAGVTR